VEIDFLHPFFTRAVNTESETPIVSNKGTVRGVRNRVKAGISVFVDRQLSKDYQALEKDRIVFYTTSMNVVRDTHDKCLLVKKILQTQRVEFDERDVFVSRDFHRELVERLGDEHYELPQVFADGFPLGNSAEVEKLNEQGTLRKIFQRFKKVEGSQACIKCGGYQFVPCVSCHGSKKSHRNRNLFTEEFRSLRCTTCDQSGLVRCDLCDINNNDKDKRSCSTNNAPVESNGHTYGDNYRSDSSRRNNHVDSPKDCSSKVYSPNHSENQTQF
jgi:glutaredoxin domain-containing cysteine-rich protein 1